MYIKQQLAHQAIINMRHQVHQACVVIVQDMPHIKRWDEGSKEIIAEMLNGSMGDFTS